ncbi:MAG: modulator protein [Sphingobium sp. 32-64-5]|nr:MAG: modulator protein [Sphingobium sp. 32-64-5]
MLTLSQAQDRAQTLVDEARRAGADAADALYVCNASTGVSVRLGQMEDVEQSEGEEIGLRIFVGQRSATISASDLERASLSALVDRCLAMAKEAPEDPYAVLAPESRLMRGKIPSLDLVDDSEVAPAELKERALLAEDAGRSVPGITNSEGGGASMGRSQIALATSHGFAGSYAATIHGTWASVLAGEGGGMQRDYASHSTRHLDDLDDAEHIGRRAGQRAVARLPSFLLDDMGARLFDSSVTIIDDPMRKAGLRSRPFDGEGLPTRRRPLIDKGELTGWLLDASSALQLGMEPTGHASRGTSGSPGVAVTNVHVEPGAVSPSDLMKGIERGIYVTELIGMGVNPVTGDYSRGASGFLIENGAVGPAVSEITIAGSLKDMFAAMIPANDLAFRYAINVPTLRVDGMMVAGG